MHEKPFSGWRALALALILIQFPGLSSAQPAPPPPIAVAPRILPPTVFGGESLSRDALRAQFGYPVYQEVFGEYLLPGRSVIQDQALALAWLKKAAAQGSDGAENTLGRLYSGEEGVQPDLAVSADWFRKAGEHGGGYSRYRLGRMYENGLGVPQDDIQAYKWYVLATRTPGYPIFHAIIDAAVARETQRLTPHQLDEAKALVEAWNPLPRTPAQQITDADQAQDPQVALRILQPMAAGGQPMAQYMLGLMYEHGKGVTLDYGAAADWYLKAALQGHAGAEIQLALLYRNGQGLAKDDATAAGWLHKAADQNVAAAESMLGQLYLDGDGVAQDKINAVTWLRKGANAGDAAAQLVLAGLCAAGREVPKDRVQAYVWARLAVIYNYTQNKHIDNDAKALAATLTAGMSTEQLSKADAQVMAWLPVLPSP